MRILILLISLIPTMTYSHYYYYYYFIAVTVEEYGGASFNIVTPLPEAADCRSCHILPFIIVIILPLLWYYVDDIM